MIFSVVNIAVFTDKKTHLSETIQVQISVASIEVQAQTIAAGFELETTEADIEARVFPVLIEIPTAPELTKIEILTNDLEAMRANSNGLELFCNCNLNCTSFNIFNRDISRNCAGIGCLHRSFVSCSLWSRSYQHSHPGIMCSAYYSNYCGSLCSSFS